MQNNSGWVSIHRKIIDSPIYTDSQAVHLWLHLLLMASHSDSQFVHNGKIKTIKRGQILTGRHALSSQTGLNDSKVERLLTLFEGLQMIEQQKNSKSRLISITKYDTYQQSEQQLNSKRTTNEQQMNTYNNDNNDNNNIPAEKPKKKPVKPELPIETIMAHGVPEQVAKDYIAHRRAIKATLSVTAWNGIVREAQKAGMTLEDVLTLSMVRGWRGFEAKFVKGNQQAIPFDQPKTTPTDYAKMLGAGND